MGENFEFEVPSWEQIYDLLLNLAKKVLKANFMPDLIVGVSRGGWPPARIMSDLLEKPELASVKAEFYLGVDETKSEPIITQPVSASVEGKRVLVVDDVADTGESLRLVKSHLKEQGAKEVKLATIYYKPWSILTPDWYLKETRAWVVFPWERKETVRNIVEKYIAQGKSIDEAKESMIRCGLDRRLVDKFVQEILEGQI